MATIRQRANGTWEFVFKKAGVLPKPLYMTFQSKEEGLAYEANLVKLLDRGIIPAEHQPSGGVMTIRELDNQYQRDAHPSEKDKERLTVIVRQHGHLPIHNITATWVDAWIERMKREEHLAPASIRARVGALARATDWAMRKGFATFPDHPLRSLPKGYAQYTEVDAALAGSKKVDIERDRRLEHGEEANILAMIEGGVLPRKQRPHTLPHKEATRIFFLLALETAMRMREMYTLRWYQVDLAARTIFLDKTKNGDKRQVPLSSVAMQLLRVYKASEEPEEGTLVFPFWEGDESVQGFRKASDWVSSHFERIFVAAGCKDLGFHDLRHEATSRFFEKTAMLESKIMKITGHKNHRTMMRYANLRGSVLADELW